jgi:hypothetical protein
MAERAGERKRRGECEGGVFGSTPRAHVSSSVQRSETGEVARSIARDGGGVRRPPPSPDSAGYFPRARGKKRCHCRKLGGFPTTSSLAARTAGKSGSPWRTRLPARAPALLREKSAG